MLSKEELTVKRNDEWLRLAIDEEYHIPSFSLAWDACTEILWPEIERLRNQIKQKDELLSNCSDEFKDGYEYARDLERKLEICVKALEQISQDYASENSFLATAALQNIKGEN